MGAVKRAFTRLGIIFAGWTLLAVLQATNLAIYRVDVAVPIRFLQTLRFCLLDYWLWAALTPIIFYLARRFPFSRQTWIRTTALHFGFYLIVTWVHESLAHVIGIPTRIPSGFHGSIVWLRFVSSLDYDLWMYWPAVLVWSLFEYYQRYRERDMRAAQLKEQLARAELQALRNQLHPHFLFNTLNSIASLMHEDVGAADDMLGDLSHLLRGYLSRSNEQEIPLCREIELLETYTRIQKRRFEDRLSWRLDVPEGLMDAAIPALLLQPLVENSIVHGIAPRSQPGQVSVSARRNGSALNLEVIDDGLGLPEGYVEGIGLSNTRSRLRQLYGEQHLFELTRGGNGGVVIKIGIPLRFLPPQSEFDLDDDTNRGRGRRTAGPTADSVVAEGR